MNTKSKNLKRNKVLQLSEVLQHESFTVLSVNVSRKEQARLSQRGIEPGLKIEVIYNNHRGTVAVRSRRALVILGRHETYKIRLLPRVKPIKEALPVSLPEVLYLTSLEG